VAAEVARELQAPLDVIVVRKLGVPFQPELAMGAIGEGGARVVDAEVMRGAKVTRDDLAKVEAREREELQRRAQRFRAGREQVSLAGHVVVIVDDGVATGSTARAACQVARAQGAARIVLAVPVAPVGWQRRFTGVADELICIATPDPFWGISGFYADFSQIRDEEVLACLAEVGPTARDGSSTAETPDPCPPAVEDEIQVPVGEVELAGWLTVPASTRGVVVLAHGSGCSGRSVRSQLVARLLNRASLATLLFDLLTPPEGVDRAKRFDIDLLAARLGGATEWLRHQSRFADLPVGWLGTNTGAAAALQAAAEPDADTAAVVCRGGRPDLVVRRLCMVRAPTLLIVGGLDPVVLDLNRKALARLRCRSRLTVIPGVTHLFTERGALETATAVARAWFLENLGRAA
jgi:putative phosphoribosyl transferase